MNATAPWWASGLFGIVGALIGTFATLSLGVLNRRTERRRLSRTEKVALYPSLTRAANQLVRLPVWPEDSGNPRDLRDDIETIAESVVFIAPTKVATTVITLLTAAENLSDTILAIRRDSRPGHSDKVDQRYAERLATATNELKAAIRAFGTNSRKDIEVGTPYVPLHQEPAP